MEKEDLINALVNNNISAEEITHSILRSFQDKIYRDRNYLCNKLKEIYIEAADDVIEKQLTDVRKAMASLFRNIEGYFRVRRLK